MADTDAGTLVGRGREQATLRQHLDAAIAGRGRVVLIGGEAGIGKTALAEAVCREAEEQGALMLVGRCYDLTETPPYGPWVEAFARYPSGEDVPPLPEAFAERGTVGAVASQDALFRQVLDFFAALTAVRPVVLLLDDLHWADPGSLDLLRFLARAVSALPLLVLVTYRSDELTRRHPLYALLPVLERESAAVRVDLRRLSSDAVRALVAARYTLAPPDVTGSPAIWMRGRRATPSSRCNCSARWRRGTPCARTILAAGRSAAWLRSTCRWRCGR
jgi:predicted ATPase